MSHSTQEAAGRPEMVVLTGPPSPDEIDRNLFMDFLSRKVMKGWMENEPRPSEIPWTPLGKPLTQCRLALVSSAGVALAGDPPFDQEGERRNPWWGDPSYRLIPLGTRTEDVRVYHLHIDASFAERDLNCVLPLDRAEELAAGGEIGSVAPTHYSFMGYLLRPEEFLRTSVCAMIERMQAESVDLALLAPVWPFCCRSVGLAARAIEAAGIPTITLSMLPAYTRAVGAPRVVGVDHPFNRPLGLVGDADGQRAVLRAALHSIEVMDGPGAAVQLPFVWPEGRAQARGKLEPPPVARLIQQKPWLLLKFMRGETGD